MKLVQFKTKASDDARLGVINNDVIVDISEIAPTTLEFIKRAQSLGFTLEEIKRIIDESRAGHRPCAEVREPVRRRLAELDEQMAQIRRYRNALAATLRQWDEKGFADGDFCGLIESADLSSMRPERNNLKRKGK